MVVRETRLADTPLVEDFVTVQNAITSPRIKGMQDGILSGIASNEEIEEHYRTFDAIDGQTSFKNERARYLHLKRLGRVALADFMGGAQMITSAISSGLIEQNQGYDRVLSLLFRGGQQALVQHQLELGNIEDRDLDSWNRLVDYVNDGPTTPAIKNLTERVGLLHYARLIGTFEDDVIATSTDALRTISLGRTIMREGTIGFRHYIDVQPSEAARSADERSMASTLVDIAENPHLQLGLSSLILRSGNRMQTVEAKDIFLQEMRSTFGPQLSWPTASHARQINKYLGQYYQVDVSIMREMQEHSFADALTNMQSLIGFAKATNPDMFKKGRIKGSLHEVLWVLDAYALRKGLPDEYGEYVVSSATNAEDMPFLGKPAMKRGFDFVVQDKLYSANRRLIQIGASGRKVSNKTEQTYHPSIEVYCEKSFNEVNLSTLEKKIATYKKWSDHGFTKQDFEKLNIKEQLLGTVKECFQVR